jgi:small ligand-binding sensory domain FIST
MSNRTGIQPTNLTERRSVAARPVLDGAKQALLSIRGHAASLIVLLGSTAKMHMQKAATVFKLLT